MKNSFLRKILAAGTLTRRGRLMEATHAIQRALSDWPVAPSAASPGATRSTDAAAGRPATASRADSRVVEATVVERPAAAPVRERVDAPSPAPAADAGTARFSSSSYTAAAGTRAYKLFEPAGFAGQALPLVVMLHGCTQDPDDFAAGTRMNVLAQELGWLVLYPAQAARSNAHKCWNWFAPADQRRGAGEPALLAGMTRHVLQTHAVDPDRVYVAGLSAGAAMAAILAREYADLYAAAGIHSGLPAGAAHDVASAFASMKSGVSTNARAAAGPAGAPVIVFHGQADATVVAANGDAVIAGALAAGGPAVRLDVDVAAAPGRRGYRQSVWRAADGAAREDAGGASGASGASLAEQWVVHGAGHAWSGGASAGSYTDPSGPDASREMLRFFREHARRHDPS